MSKRKVEPEPPEPLEPKITYNRTLSLVAPDGGVKLSHLRELLAEASDRGFVPGAKVTIQMQSSIFGSYQQIDIGES